MTHVNVTRDMWHVTHDMWHMVGVKILSKFQLPSSFGFGAKVIWILYQTRFVFVLCDAQGNPPGFWNGLDWRAMVKLCPPNIGNLG